MTDATGAAIAREWLPIETAPSGKTLIGWADTWDEPELIYREADRPWQEGFLGDFIDIGFEPTHWQPLPEPPTL